ncbi:hypothetical protein [Novosphingobium kaempferiae]|uniref:hypothetical protein n=1 Tax=Novosphingobium kaempferiae TaxID=2896849 RepID=UPI001E5EDD32|nr:hypothetical protein [Novosphingobium kaempferiae]
MADDALIALAQHRFEQADRFDATYDDCRLLHDIFPAVIQRLREKVEVTRDFVALDRSATEVPKNWEKQAAIVDSRAEDEQMQLTLLHI